MPHPFYIYSLDGGDSRGIKLAKVPVQMKRETNTPNWKRFDLKAGTSTGGILALVLTIPGEPT